MTRVSTLGLLESVGKIEAKESPWGLILTPKLSGLPTGVHGFHVHANPSCDVKVKEDTPVAALGAGGHFDPLKTGKHEGPFGKGHLGDLPVLIVDKEGNATQPVLAPRLTVARLKGRSIMIHAGGDNYSDQPAALGGGGARIACGVIKK